MVQCLSAEIQNKSIRYDPRPSTSTFVVNCLNVSFVVYTCITAIASNHKSTAVCWGKTTDFPWVIPFDI